MRRTLYISVIILVLITGGLPVTVSLAKWSRRAAVVQHRRHRRHSRAWWRRHRALMRARRARAEQRQQEQQQLAAGRAVDTATGLPVPGARALVIDNTQLRVTGAAASARASRLPFDFQVPANWTPLAKAPAGVAAYSIRTPDGRQAGVGVVSPVTLTASDLAAAPASPRAKSIGGLPVAALRRTVIDRMVAEGGWVTNDSVREMHGRRVFVVVAQTGAPGAPTKSWAFYFTEVDGRVYSIATNAPVEFAEPVAAGSEQLMATLRPAASRNVASQK